MSGLVPFIQMRKLKHKENVYGFLVSRATSGIAKNRIKDVLLLSILSSVKEISISYFILYFLITFLS